MGTTLVSARVPRAKKEAAGSILHELGSTASELVNSAYDYLLAERELPRAKSTPRAQRDFRTFVAESTLDIGWEDVDGLSCYKDLLAQGRRSRYESLA